MKGGESMYYILTHGWGNNPEKHITTSYRNYKKARAALKFLFDAYQSELESGRPSPESFVCILKTKGVCNGKTK